MSEIRTRFAPSPTGSLHIGSLRTALYAYAFAKSQKGKFILRIEDTDRTRFVPGATEKLCEMLKKFGIKWDEGPEVGGPYAPYIQSERAKLGIYEKYAEKLVAEGHAYYCFCPSETKEQIKKRHEKKLIQLRDQNCCHLSEEEIRRKIDSGEKPAIRLKIPENEEVSYYDFILKKEISWNTKDIDEVMLLKSDGFPTYHLAVVVDDALMEISHITRGHDWLPSTPVHLLLFKYLGFKLPQIGHLTDILDPSGGKLSKRKGSVSCEEFLAEGYLPEAILNFIMLLGWAPKDNRELFTLQEFVENFQKGSLQISNPVFNRKKLDWFNGYYIRQKTDQELFVLIKSYLSSPSGLPREVPTYVGTKWGSSCPLNEDFIEKTIPLVKDRMVKLTDFETLVAPILSSPNLSNLSNLANLSDLKKEYIEKAIKVLKEISDWKLEEINEKLTTLIKGNNWKIGDFYMSLRIAICGCKITPPINETIEILGKKETLSRLQKVIQVHTFEV